MIRAELYRILMENYSLSELEDRLSATLEELADGLYDYLLHHEDEVRSMLQEDLWI